MTEISRRTFGLTAAALAVAPISAAGGLSDQPVTFASVGIDRGIDLHYVESGAGTPVVFVHGSLSDYTYWFDELGPFARRYRALAYSRRYNFPNHNPARPGYSAAVDADDLAALIVKLNLGRVDIVGHSYGALTALFLAARRPDLIGKLVLAEGPAVSLLAHLSGPRAATGKAMFADIQARMVAPMRAAFARGDREGGVKIFVDYVHGDPRAWDSMSAAAHGETMRDAHEWDVMMTTGTLFPDIDPAAIARIATPTLLLSGQKSYPFLNLIDEELIRLIPGSRRVIVPGAGHQMWFDDAELCRNAAMAFLG